MRPEHTIRCGNLETAIWKEKSDNGTHYNVTTTRNYKVDGQWKKTSSLSFQDLPVAEKLIARAWQWIADEYAR